MGCGFKDFVPEANEDEEMSDLLLHQIPGKNIRKEIVVNDGKAKAVHGRR